jgi:prefoldin beta subunit
MASDEMNPGKMMTAAVDEEIAAFQALQSDLQRFRGNEQVLISQQNENEMVKQELELLDESAQVFKKNGPVLMKNDLSEAKETVQKRLEFISGELSKLRKNIETKEKKSQETAQTIQKMQSAMQRAAAEAANAIAQQHQQQASA